MFFKVMFVQERPHHLDIRNMPKELKEQVNKINIEQFNSHNQEELNRVLDYMNSSLGDMKHWSDLKTYLNYLLYRKFNFAKKTL